MLHLYRVYQLIDALLNERLSCIMLNIYRFKCFHILRKLITWSLNRKFTFNFKNSVLRLYHFLAQTNKFYKNYSSANCGSTLHFNITCINITYRYKCNMFLKTIGGVTFVSNFYPRR